MEENLLIREPNGEEFNFIFSAWLKSYKSGNYAMRFVKGETYFRVQHLLIENLLARSGVKVLIAMAKDGTDNTTDLPIVGFVCTEESGKVLHYVYVKEAFRNMGVSQSLIKAAGVDLNNASFSYWTTRFEEQFVRKTKGLSYNPYLM
jgi:hypothetical protein